MTSKKTGNDASLKKLATKYRNATLDETQKKVAEEIAYKKLTGKKEEEIAIEYGISRSTIWRWKALQAFNDEVNRIVKEFQKSHLVDVNGILMDILLNGSEKSKLKAIELYYRNQGLFKDTMEVIEKQEKPSSLDDILKELEDM
ncbi:MAG: phBC6A51 family helix-turn-helix protein [Clostridium sp.]|uniref:phBC6A51 family helix-turn-helix protein n=1 Tax=Clostridium sp. TaxID=1506 RepID=UPI0039E8DA7B